MSARRGVLDDLGVLGIVLVGLLAGCARQAVVTSGPGVQEGVGANEAVLIADLQRLQTSQEAYRTETGAYALRLTALGFSPSPGVEVDVLEATALGWAAIATTPDGNAECAVYSGDARSPRAYVGAPGDVFCRSK